MKFRPKYNLIVKLYSVLQNRNLEQLISAVKINGK